MLLLTSDTISVGDLGEIMMLIILPHSPLIGLSGNSISHFTAFHSLNRVLLCGWREIREDEIQICTLH